MSELRDRLTLSEIIGRQVKLQRAGREFKGCCPFHNEKTASFYVNDDKQFYHCFGCAAHGDAIEFVMQHGNLTFIEAVETLAAEAGMQVPEQTPEEVEKARKQKDLYALLEDTAKWFEKRLRDPANRKALGYMQERGVGDELMTQFRIGYAPADGQALRKHLAFLDYTNEQMIESGVALKSKDGREPYAFFRERIIFPVADRRGRVVAFGGRILPEHLRDTGRSDTKPPKYINSSDTPLFHKGRMLYGESHARQAAADGQAPIVVEGYLDVMACFSAGYRGAVAPLGTSLTEEQVSILWKMIPGRQKNPVLCFDGDEAGRRAAARACERILPMIKPDQSALFAFLPEGQDPDSLIRAQGRAAFEKVVNGAMPLADFLWTHHTGGRRFDTPESRAGLARTLEDEALKISDRTVQHYYRQAFRDRLFKTFGPGWAAKTGKNRLVKGAPLMAVPVSRPVFAGEMLAYHVLLAAVINHPRLRETVEEDMGRIAIPNERLDKLRQTVLNMPVDSEGLDREALCNHLKEQGFETELRAVLSEAVYTHAGFARPDAPEEDLLDGWREILGFMQKNAVRKELKEAGRVLAQDFSPDNEERILALHDVHKEPED